MAAQEAAIGDSEFYEARRAFQPTVPECLQNLKTLQFEGSEPSACVGNSAELNAIFENLFGQPNLEITRAPKEVEMRPLKVGVVLSGGPAAGGHNVICGLYDALMEIHTESSLIGFQRGPRGLFENNYMVLTGDYVDQYRNTGGFDMIGTGRDKIENEEQLQGSLNTVLEHDLDGLFIIGGDDSNTNACVVGEYFAQNNCRTCLIGIPKTIDGDLQNNEIEISFGFNTATRIYSEMVSNICRDSCSAVKAWHFIKLMGRDASHVTLETALQTQPNIALISEDVKNSRKMLSDIVDEIADCICRRSALNKNYGVVLVPEGLLQFIPSFSSLIEELNHFLALGSEHLEQAEAFDVMEDKIAYIRSLLDHTHGATFDLLPVEIQREMINERDPHGNVQVSRIPTELLLIRCVEKELKIRKASGKYNGKFSAHGHFFGYDGRCGYPTNFDCQYCYNLGRVGCLLALHGKSGYMARVYNLAESPENWSAGAVALTSMMNMEKRHGKMKPVIKKALVNVEDSSEFLYFQSVRDNWSDEDNYRYPGPIQFFGPASICNQPPKIIACRKLFNEQ